MIYLASPSVEKPPYHEIGFYFTRQPAFFFIHKEYANNFNFSFRLIPVNVLFLSGTNLS